MIEQIKKEQLSTCLDIVTCGYEETAKKFGMTEDNCPYRGRTRLPYQQFEKEFNDGYLMYGYIYKGVMVGFLSLFVVEQKANINDIVVLPAYQNLGIGDELLLFAIEKAKELKCRKIVLGMVHNNVPLRNWYQKHGFKTVELFEFEKVIYTVGKMELLL